MRGERSRVCMKYARELNPIRHKYSVHPAGGAVLSNKEQNFVMKMYDFSYMKCFLKIYVVVQ